MGGAVLGGGATEWQTLQLRSKIFAPSGTAASDTVAIETQPATIPDRHTKADFLFMIALLFIGLLERCRRHWPTPRRIATPAITSTLIRPNTCTFSHL
jgi:hypothetical protein